MGADIHMVLEKKHNNTWVGINSYEWLPGEGIRAHTNNYKELHEPIEAIGWKARSRNYRLFAALAGVRGDGPAPKGIPDDASSLARMKIDSWDGDGHSHSYGLLSEIGMTFLSHSDYAAEVLGPNRVRFMLNYLGIDSFEDEQELDTYRLVYWFDN